MEGQRGLVQYGAVVELAAVDRLPERVGDVIGRDAAVT